MVVGDALGDTGLLHNAIHRGLRVTVRGNNGKGRVQKLAARRIRLARPRLLPGHAAPPSGLLMSTAENYTLRARSEFANENDHQFPNSLTC